MCTESELGRWDEINQMNEEILKSRRNSLIGFLITLAFSSGWFSVISTNTLVDYSIAIATAVSVTLLLITLSQMANRPLVRSFHWLIYFSWPITAPVFLIKFYKWKGLLFILGAVLTYVLFSILGLYLAEYLTY